MALLDGCRVCFASQALLFCFDEFRNLLEGHDGEHFDPGTPWVAVLLKQ